MRGVTVHKFRPRNLGLRSSVYELLAGTLAGGRAWRGSYGVATSLRPLRASFSVSPRKSTSWSSAI
jgi:hypothetical protein